jgi:hypothetical protein
MYVFLAVPTHNLVDVGSNLSNSSLRDFQSRGGLIKSFQYCQDMYVLKAYKTVIERGGTDSSEAQKP